MERAACCIGGARGQELAVNVEGKTNAEIRAGLR
jgi:hypothetical protein